MPGLFKVVCLLYTCFGPVLSSNTSALEPSPTLSASYAMVSGNADVSASQASGFASRTADVTPIPSSSLVSAQSSVGQPDDGDNVFQQAAKKLEDKLEPNVEELNGKIHKEIDPTRSEPRDVTVIDMLAKMMEQTQNILTEFNNTGNATGDFFNATKGLGFVLVIEKLDCHKERSTAIPDRSDKETSGTLAKFSDYVTLKFDCPWIVINATRSRSTNLRKRRDVQIEVIMEVGAEEDENDDFHEFQMLHHPSRLRREASANCGPLRCGVNRFLTTMEITNRLYNDSLQDKASAYYDKLETEIKQMLIAEVKLVKIDDVQIVDFFGASGSGVLAKFYLDVDGSYGSESHVEVALKNATNGTKLGLFEVGPSDFSAKYVKVVNGNYSQWSDWSTCDNKFEEYRTRTCDGSQHGGICHGHDKEIKKCSKKSRVKSKHPALIDNAVIFRKNPPKNSNYLTTHSVQN